MFKGLDGFHCRITNTLKSTDTYISIRPEDMVRIKNALLNDFTYLTLRECGRYEVVKVLGTDMTSDNTSSGQMRVERDQIGTGAFTFTCTSSLFYELNTLCVQEVISNRLVNYALKSYADALERRISTLEQKG